jgi:hypothetical protein
VTVLWWCTALVAGAMSAAASQDTRPPADARLQIEVVDPAGRPVPGASVFVLPAERFTGAYTRIFDQEGRNPQRFEPVERYGTQTTTDSAGRAVVERASGPWKLVAKAPDLYAFLENDASDASVRVALEPDQELRLLALDIDGALAPNVEMVIAAPLTLERDDFSIASEDPIYDVGGCVWIGTTASDGVARVEHAQCIVRSESGRKFFAALGIPMSSRVLLPLGEHALPTDPIVFQMPPTGRVVVEGPRQAGSTFRIRRAPHPWADALGGCVWSNYAPGSRRPHDGRAEFEHVEIGLEIQAQAVLPARQEPISVLAHGPASAGESVTIRVEIPQNLAQTRPGSRIVVTEEDKEVDVHWIALTPRRSDNTEFIVCFEPVEGKSDPERHLHVQERMWHPSVWCHRGNESDAWHYAALVSSRSVEQISRETGLEPARYVENAFSLDAKFSTDQDSYQSGQEVLVRLEIENTGTASIRWNDWGRKESFSPYSNFHFTSSPGDQASLGPRAAGYGASIGGQRSVISPGQKIVLEAELSSWFFFPTAGPHEVTADYELQLVDLDPLPTFLGAVFCPVAARDCVDILKGRFTVVIR